VRDGLAKSWKRESLDHWRKVGQYYPSGIGSCLRKQFYDFVSPKPPTPEELALFATGKGIHETVAEALRKSGLVKVDQVEMPVTLNLSSEVSLSGRVDIILAEMSGKRVIVEVKSSSRLPDQPHENHTMQLQTYLHALNLELGLLLYWDKRTGQLASFRVERDASWLKRIGERTFMLDAHLRVKKAPFREAFFTGKYWECDYCPYLAECDPFAVQGVTRGSKLALVGISAQGGEASPNPVYQPDINSIKRLVYGLKAEGDVVILLADFLPGLEPKIVENLKSSGVPYDAFLSKPMELDSVRLWKVELGRRLSTNYQIASFLDSDEAVLDMAAKFARRVQKLAPS
jgi:hypothetical protein